MRRVKRQLAAVVRMLNRNNCASNPCQNGGTCTDTYRGFICQCPDNWEGETCQNDVNECEHFAHTDLGCQNGAVCQNLPGTYRFVFAYSIKGLRTSSEFFVFNCPGSFFLCLFFFTLSHVDNKFLSYCSRPHFSVFGRSSNYDLSPADSAMHAMFSLEKWK